VDCKKIHYDKRELKTKCTNLKLYGVDNAFKCEDKRKKYKQTMISVYGADHNFKVEEIVNKRNETWDKKYGGNPFKNTEIKNKIKTTLLSLYNEDNISKVQEYKDKKISTCMKNCGVESPAHVTDIHEKQQKYRWKDYKMPSGKIIKLQGYENIFLDEYFKEGNKEETIIYQRKLIPRIWYYTEDGKKHRYFPDFYIPKDNLIIEVKSNWTMKKYLEKNLLKEQACIDSGYKYKFKIYEGTT